MQIIIEPCDLTAFAPSQANRFAKFTADLNKLVTRVPDVNLDMVDAMGDWNSIVGGLDEVLAELLKTSARPEFSDITFSMMRKFFVEGEETMDTYATVKNGTVLFRAEEDEFDQYDPNREDAPLSEAEYRKLFSWDDGPEPEDAGEWE